jgi:hypothetical protein
MTLVRCIPVLILLSVVAGCSSMHVTADFDPEVDFAVYKSWDWLPGGPPETGDRRLDSAQFRERIGRLIGEEFAARGFPLSTDKPDFYVIYHAALDQELKSRNIENYYEYINYAVFSPRVTSSYTEGWDIGTLLIDVFDVKTHSLVWRGTSRIELNYQAGPRENEPIIRKALQKMLEKFPPK